MISGIIHIALLPFRMAFLLIGESIRLFFAAGIPLALGYGAVRMFAQDGFYPSPATYTILMLIAVLLGFVMIAHWAAIFAAKWHRLFK